MVAQPQPTLFTEREYLALEAVAEVKHEYSRRLIIAMAGAEFGDNRIVSNALVELARLCGDGPCVAVGSDQRVKVEATHEYYYPDVTVVCGEPKLVGPAPRSLANPSIIVEVQSPSTAGYDAGDKLESYRQITTLDDYLMVASDRRSVTHYQRKDDDWGVRSLGPGARVELHNGLVLEVDRLYRQVEGV